MWAAEPKRSKSTEATIAILEGVDVVHHVLEQQAAGIDCSQVFWLGSVVSLDSSALLKQLRLLRIKKGDHAVDWHSSEALR
jgi:hypothetical protein